jgi:type I restriction enzyme S subunit
MNEGEWKEKQIDELGETINGLSGKSGDDFGTGKPYVTYKQVFDNSLVDFSVCGKVNISENENQNTLQKGDILFTTSSETPNEVGFASVLLESPKETTYLNSFCFALRPFEIEEIQPKFSRYLFHSPIYRKSIITLAQGITRYNISKGAFKNLKLPLPKPNEQQKIASCLSSLDEVIAANSQKMELLKEHKKGLMQNLFPKEGETVPKWRFPEFLKDGEWKEKKLGEIGEPLMCKRIFKEQTTINAKNGIPFYKIGTFGRVADSYISIELYNQYKSKFSFPKIGEILISAAGTIGRLVVYDGSPAFFQDSNIVWLGNNEVLVLNRFLFHCYSKIEWQTSDGGIISRLYNSDLKNMKILFPKGKIEQQKISECLSSIDELITVQMEKLEQLKFHKKGLMQGLFPKIID